MATAFTSSNLISVVGPGRAISQATAGNVVQRRRNLSPEAGRAIELLGHAIEYLADEIALDCLDPSMRAKSEMFPRLQAIEMLMARNRDIYLSCAEAPTLAERLRNWFRVWPLRQGV